MGRLNVAASVALLMLLSVGPALAEEGLATAPAHEATSKTNEAIDRLGAPDVGARRAAAAEVAKLGKDDVPTIASALAAARKAPPGTVTAAIKATRPSADLADALIDTKSDGAGYGAAVTTAVLLRTLAAIGTTPAARELVRVSGDHSGVFRPEIARHLKTLGEKAVPALLEMRKESAFIRTWASAQLESMGKRVPADAVQTQDNQILADVLRAFAIGHDVDALPVLLSFVNSDRIQIRTAAREAVLEFGQDATWKLREAYANVTSKAAPEGLPAAQIARDLFAAYDRLRLQEVYALIDEGLAKQKDGQLDDALLAFDKVLARQPMIERRSEMVPAYVAKAEALEESDPTKALSLLHKAERLWPEGPRTPQIHAQLAYLEGKQLLAHGITDVEPFKRSLEFDPTNQKARDVLRHLEAQRQEHDAQFRLYASIATAIVVATAGLILFGGRRRPRARA